jgi:hypothetical protein
MIHLHWLWRYKDRYNGDNITKAAAACGVTGLGIGTWSPDVEKVNCKHCLRIANRKPEPEPEPDAQEAKPARRLKYKNRRPESPKGQVFEAFSNDGPEAARKLAVKLGIGEGRIKRWLEKEFV